MIQKAMLSCTETSIWTADMVYSGMQSMHVETGIISIRRYKQLNSLEFPWPIILELLCRIQMKNGRLYNRNVAMFKPGMKNICKF